MMHSKPHSTLNLRPLAGAALLLVLPLGGSLPACAQPVPTPSGAAAAAPQGPMAPSRPPMERRFHMGPRGRWWDDPQMAQKLGLSADQQKKMDDIFLQSRLALIDKHAAVEKEETLLEPLISADQPDESRILAQIDKVAQARAELEKTNARMLLGLRGILTPAQWKTLKTMAPRRGGRFGDRGPDAYDGHFHRHLGPDGPDDGPGAPGRPVGPGASDGPGGAE